MIVYFEQVFLKNTKINGPHFWATFFNRRGYTLIWQENRLGYILGDFFTNSSGHPGSDVRVA
jgi:hypothetical protein